MSSIAGKYDKASIEEKMKRLKFAKRPTEQQADKANWFKQFQQMKTTTSEDNHDLEAQPIKPKNNIGLSEE